jgi:lycopene cyclase domain-containing protein
MFFSSFFIYPKAYTFSVCFILGLVLPITLQFLDNNRMDKLVLAFLISLLPMFVVNGFLTALPVVIYNDSQNLGIRLGTIPVEDFAYNAILLAINVSLYEWQVKKSANPA